MFNGDSFQRLIREAYVPFLKELGFSGKPVHVSGKYYCAYFVSTHHTLSVSYEPGDHYWDIRIETHGGAGDLKSFDDRSITPHLADLNTRYQGQVSGAERSQNETFFDGIEAKNADEAYLLKCAKDLRIVLPKYLGI
jgi:hypothetical protein